MRFSLLTLLLFCTYVLPAQSTALDFAVAPTLTYRRLAAPDGNVADLARIEGHNGRESPVVTSYAGVHYQWRVAPKTWLRTGLRLTSFGVEAVYSNLRWGSQHDGNGGFDPTLDPGLPSNIRVRADRFFLDVPLLIRRAFGDGNWTPYLEAGLLPGAYLTTRFYSRTDTEDDVDYVNQAKQSVRRLHLGGSLAVGVARTLNERYAIYFQPVFRYQLTALAKGPIRERAYGGGLEVGLRRSLR